MGFLFQDYESCWYYLIAVNLQDFPFFTEVMLTLSPYILYIPIHANFVLHYHT